MYVTNHCILILIYLDFNINVTGLKLDETILRVNPGLSRLQVLRRIHVLSHFLKLITDLSLINTTLKLLLVYYDII